MLSSMFEMALKFMLHLVGREVTTRILGFWSEKLVSDAVKLLPKERRQEKFDEWMSEIEQNNRIGRYATSIKQALGLRLSAPYTRQVMLGHRDSLASSPNPVVSYVSHLKAALATRVLENFANTLWKIIIRLPEGGQRSKALNVFVKSSVLMMYYKRLHHPKHYNLWFGNFVETQLETDNYIVRTSAQAFRQNEDIYLGQPSILILLWAAWHVKHVPGFLPHWTFDWAKSCYLDSSFQTIESFDKLTLRKAWNFVFDLCGCEELDFLALYQQSKVKHG